MNHPATGTISSYRNTHMNHPATGTISSYLNTHMNHPATGTISSYRHNIQLQAQYQAIGTHT